MTLLSLQLLIQVSARLNALKTKKAEA